ncbi:MAG: hypothetical protein WBW54_03435, partial [Candidatus Acidiferrales bacterium]
HIYRLITSPKKELLWVDGAGVRQSLRLARVGRGRDPHFRTLEPAGGCLRAMGARRSRRGAARKLENFAGKAPR